jgi:TPP-dependent indolepyruvate ferredoxin oxidoreductase alpha subunit
MALVMKTASRARWSVAETLAVATAEAAAMEGVQAVAVVVADGAAQAVDIEPFNHFGESS